MMSAPARRIAVSVSSIARGSSIQPLRRGSLQHRVLAADVIRRRRIVERFLHARDDVEIGDCRLHHDDVGAFLDVLRDFAQRFVAVGGIHLVRAPIAERRRRRRGVAERTVERGAILGGIGHDRGLVEAALVERLADCADTAVHHVRRSDDVSSGDRVRHRRAHQLLDRRVVHDLLDRRRCRSDRGRCIRTGTRRSSPGRPALRA